MLAFPYASLGHRINFCTSAWLLLLSGKLLQSLGWPTPVIRNSEKCGSQCPYCACLLPRDLVNGIAFHPSLIKGVSGFSIYPSITAIQFVPCPALFVSILDRRPWKRGSPLEITLRCPKCDNRCGFSRFRPGPIARQGWAKWCAARSDRIPHRIIVRGPVAAMASGIIGSFTATILDLRSMFTTIRASLIKIGDAISGFIIHTHVPTRSPMPILIRHSSPVSSSPSSTVVFKSCVKGPLHREVHIGGVREVRWRAVF